MRIVSVERQLLKRIVIANCIHMLFAGAALFLIASGVLSVEIHIASLINRWQSGILVIGVSLMLLWLFSRLVNWNARIKSCLGVETVPLPEPARFETGGVLLWKSGVSHKLGVVYPAKMLPVLVHFAALAVLLGLVECGSGWVAHKRLEAVKAELAAKGYKTSMTQYDSGRHGADRLYPTMRKSLDDKARREISKIKIEKWDAAMAEQAIGLSVKYDAALEKIIPLLDKREYSDPMDYQTMAREPFTAPVPHYGPALAVSKLLLVKMYLSAEHGGKAAAWRYLDRQLLLSELTGSSSVFVAKLVWMFMYGDSADMTANILLRNSHMTLPPAVIGQFKAMQEKHPAREGLRTEMAVLLDSAEFMRWNWKWWLPKPFDVWLFFRQSALYYLPTPLWWLGFGADIAAFTHMPYLVFLSERFTGDWTVAAPAIGKLEDATFLRFERLMVYPLMWELASASVVAPPRFIKIYAREVSMRAKIRLALAISALNGYRNKSGRYPQKLEQLVPSFSSASDLQNPFTGKPFIYSVDAPGHRFRLSADGVPNYLTDGGNSRDDAPGSEFSRESR